MQIWIKLYNCNFGSFILMIIWIIRKKTKFYQFNKKFLLKIIYFEILYKNKIYKIKINK